ncbi:MAG: hypothetical protein K2J51_01530 [Alistipes sp.]|nr:hypothetical protein [Alistipes sp.]
MRNDVADEAGYSALDIDMVYVEGGTFMMGAPDSPNYLLPVEYKTTAGSSLNRRPFRKYCQPRITPS